MPLETLAKYVGRSRSAVWRWECDESLPKLAERRVLAFVLRSDVETLFPADEPAVYAAARQVVAARTVADLRVAVTRLGGVLAEHDAANEGKSA